MRRLLTPLLVLTLLVLPGPPAGAHDDPDHQLSELSARLEQEPDSAALHLERAELHRFRRDWAAGLADLQAASRLDPSMAAVDLALARLMLDAGNLPAALDAADRFLARSPRHLGGLLLKARILHHSGRRADAASAYTFAIDLQRERRGDGGAIQPDDYLDRARDLFEEGRHDEALQGLDEGLAALGQPVTLQLLAIELEEKRGNTDAALVRLAALESRANRKETWMARRGDVLARAGRREESARAYRDALAAIAALPPRLRSSSATTELEASLRARLGAVHTDANAAPAAVASSRSQGESREP